MDEAAPRAAGGTPLSGVSEDELLKRARRAMMRAAALPPGSLGRSVQWGVYDTMMAELNRRAVRWMLSRLGGGG